MLDSENFILISLLYSVILNFYFLFQSIKKDYELNLYRKFFEHLEEISQMSEEEFTSFMKDNNKS